MKKQLTMFSPYATIAVEIGLQLNMVLKWKHF